MSSSADDQSRGYTGGVSVQSLRNNLNEVDFIIVKIVKIIDIYILYITNIVKNDGVKYLFLFYNS